MINEISSGIPPAFTDLDKTSSLGMTCICTSLSTSPDVVTTSTRTKSDLTLAFPKKLPKNLKQTLRNIWLHCRTAWIEKFFRMQTIFDRLTNLRLITQKRNTYLLHTEFKVRTVSCGPNKKKFRNLQYGWGKEVSKIFTISIARAEIFQLKQAFEFRGPYSEIRSSYWEIRQKRLLLKIHPTRSLSFMSRDDFIYHLRRYYRIKCVYHTYQSWKQSLFFEKAKTTENQKKGTDGLLKLG